MSFLSVLGPTKPAYPPYLEAVYDTPGTYSWQCPPGVTSVCVVCVGGGGSTHGYSTNAGTAGTASYFNAPATVNANGGARGGGSGGGAGGTGTAGTGGGSGGAGGAVSGGGAGGWSSAGGAGVSYNGTGGVSSSGGGAGGGVGTNNNPGTSGAGGGGTGVLMGQGTAGAGGIPLNTKEGRGGGGGSGGYAGQNSSNPSFDSNPAFAGDGGWPGGGGGGGYGVGYPGGGGGLRYINNFAVTPGNNYTVVVGSGGVPASGPQLQYMAAGAGGVVRIIWGTGRSFPNAARRMFTYPPYPEGWHVVGSLVFAVPDGTFANGIAAATAAAAASTLGGYSAGSWRLPTYIEMQALASQVAGHNLIASGWASGAGDWHWTSTVQGGSNYYVYAPGQTGGSPVGFSFGTGNYRVALVRDL